MSFTTIPIEEAHMHIVTCDDCDAYAATESEVIHHDICTKRECKNWMSKYSKKDYFHEIILNSRLLKLLDEQILKKD